MMIIFKIDNNLWNGYNDKNINYENIKLIYYKWKKNLEQIIIGMGGFGVETAKNIILNGPDEVDIFDPFLIKINDLGSNLYFSENDVVKKRRDEVIVLKLSDLNPSVKVSILDFGRKKNIIENITIFLEKIEKYNGVAFTELHPMTFIEQADKAFRSKNIKFIYGFCFGLWELFLQILALIILFLMKLGKK